jgi:hypothetical protein
LTSSGGSSAASGCGGGSVGWGAFLDEQGQFGAGRDRPADVWFQMAGNGVGVEEGVAPVIESDEFGQ